MNVTENVRSARMVKVVRAATLIWDLPPSTKRDLNNGARAVRLLIEAHSLAAANEALELLLQIAVEALGTAGAVPTAVRHSILHLAEVLP